MSPYREIDHTADWAMQVWAPNLMDLFLDAARGMYALTGAEPAPAAQPVSRRLELQAPDCEALLVTWLQELLYLTESEGLLLAEAQLEALTPTRLQAEVQMCRLGHLHKMIKAVTFHNLSISQTEAGYATTLVFDV